MAFRKSWTQQQDLILKYLKEQEKVQNWCLIAKIMQKKYKICDRNQKQCRQRYHNHLDPTIKNDKLDEKQQKQLFKLHDQIGNRWSIIAKNFIGRSDNYLKNIFHSKLRGSIRKLNRFIKEKTKKLHMNVKPYPIKIVYKIVQSCDIKFYSTPQLQVKRTFFINLKNKLLQFNQKEIFQKSFLQKNQQQISLQLIKEINQFLKLYKLNKKKDIKVHTNNIKSNCKKIQDHRTACTGRRGSQGQIDIFPSLFMNFRSSQKEQKPSNNDYSFDESKEKSDQLERNQAQDREYRNFQMHQNESNILANTYESISFLKSSSLQFVSPYEAQKDIDISFLLEQIDIQLPQNLNKYSSLFNQNQINQSFFMFDSQKGLNQHNRIFNNISNQQDSFLCRDFEDKTFGNLFSQTTMQRQNIDPKKQCFGFDMIELD